MAILPIRSHFDNAEIYQNGTARQLGWASCDLPDLTFQSNETKGAGLAGVIKIPSATMTDSLELTIHWRTINEYALTYLESQAHDLDIYAAEQTYDNATRALSVEQHHVYIRGLPMGLTLGKYEPNAESDTESKFEVVMMRYYIAGNLIVDLDKTAYRFNVNGGDWSGGLRRALGLE